MSNMFDRVVEKRKKKHVLNVDSQEHVPYDDSHKDEKEHELMTTATAVNPTQGNVKQFEKYAKLGKSNAAIQRRIALLLATLSQITTVESVKRVCDDEKAWFLEHYTSASARTSYMSAYRKAIKACFDEIGIPEGLSSERETAKGLVTQHIAMNHMMAPAADYETKRQQNKSKTAKQRDNLTAFDMDATIKATEDALDSDDWRELAAGLIMAVQARPSDILQSGDFKAISKYTVEFTSRAKKRGSSVSGSVWTLVDSVTFIDAFNRLRRYPDVLALKTRALKDIDSQKNSTINRAIQRIFSEIIPAPYGETELSAKNLRAAGVNVAYHLYGRDDQAIGRFAELQLLHDNPGTAANYEDYYCVDTKGKRIGNVGIRKDSDLKVKPKSRTTTRPTLDKQIVEQLEALGGTESTKENVIQVIAKVQQYEKLKAENERLKTKLQVAEERIEVLKTQPNVELIHLYPNNTKSTKRESDDVTKIPNADLIGSKKRGAAEEKLRRTIEAIKAYNTDRPFEEQIAINKGSLRKITKVKAQTVNEWVDEHSEEIEAYTDAQGHGYRQNVGKDLSVIKWDEDAYGVYEWPEKYFN